MNKFIEIKASNKSIAKRKLVFGFGVNDADYIVNLRRNGKLSRCKIYTRWHEMLKRCYCDKYQYKNPTYIGCYVCDDWLIFSNFKRWVENHN